MKSVCLKFSSSGLSFKGQGYQELDGAQFPASIICLKTRVVLGGYGQKMRL